MSAPSLFHQIPLELRLTVLKHAQISFPLSVNQDSHTVSRKTHPLLFINHATSAWMEPFLYELTEPVILLSPETAPEFGSEISQQSVKGAKHAMIHFNMLDALSYTAVVPLGCEFSEEP